MNHKNERNTRKIVSFFNIFLKLNQNSYLYDKISGWPTEPEGWALACRHVLQRDREEEDPAAVLPLQRRGPLLLGHLAQQRPVRCHLDEQSSGKAYDLSLKFFHIVMQRPYFYSQIASHILWMTTHKFVTQVPNSGISNMWPARCIWVVLEHIKSWWIVNFDQIQLILSVF